MTQYANPVQPVPLITKDHFADYFLIKADDLVLDSYLITIDHKSADNPRAANHSLNQFLPIFFSRTIASHWYRHQDQFELHAFLDMPGTRRSKLPSQYLHTKSQAAYHHHGILIMSHALSQRFQKKCLEFIPDNPWPGDVTNMSDFRLSFVESSNLMWKKMQFMFGHGVLYFNRTHLVNCPIRSCCVQPLDDRDDIHRAATYAAKAYQLLSKSYPDEAYQVFPR
jgi:hypothetical protein